jgi:hypothetical protein
MADEGAAWQQQQQQQHEQCAEYESREQRKPVKKYYNCRDQKEQCLHAAAANHAHALTVAAREAFAGSPGVEGLTSSTSLITCNITSTGSQFRARVTTTGMGLFAKHPKVQAATRALVQAVDEAAAEMIDAAEQGARFPIPEAVVRKGAAAVAARPPTASSVRSGTAAKMAQAGVTLTVNYLKDNVSYNGEYSRAHFQQSRHCMQMLMMLAGSYLLLLFAPQLCLKKTCTLQPASVHSFRWVRKHCLCDMHCCRRSGSGGVRCA